MNGAQAQVHLVTAQFILCMLKFESGMGFNEISFLLRVYGVLIRRSYLNPLTPKCAYVTLYDHHSFISS
jgi:hypothetical protein